MSGARPGVCLFLLSARTTHTPPPPPAGSLGNSLLSGQPLPELRNTRERPKLPPGPPAPSWSPSGREARKSPVQEAPTKNENHSHSKRRKTDSSQWRPESCIHPPSHWELLPDSCPRFLPLSCGVLGDPALARVWSAGPWPRPNSAWSLAGIQGEIKSSRGQEGPPGLDRRAQQAGPDRSGGDGELPASLTALALSSRARSCPRLSTNKEGAFIPRVSSPGVGKDEVSRELSRVPENHQRLLPVSLWPESRVTRESWRGSRSRHST